jgi:hypothetical protein
LWVLQSSAYPSYIFKILSESDKNGNLICNELLIKPAWNSKDFKQALIILKNYKVNLQLSISQVESIKSILTAKRELLVNLTQNPALLEHGSFSDLLLATFHLADELAFRTDLNSLPNTDWDHLNIDAKRVYSELLLEWVKYMKHLKNNYPYLYSLSCRTNPLNKNCEAVIK